MEECCSSKTKDPDRHLLSAIRDQPGLLRGEWHHQAEGKETKTGNQLRRPPVEGHYLAAAKGNSTRRH